LNPKDIARPLTADANAAMGAASARELYEVLPDYVRAGAGEYVLSSALPNTTWVTDYNPVRRYSAIGFVSPIEFELNDMIEKTAA
jgi:hypothetical protein